MGPLPTPTASAETTSAPSCKQQQQQQQQQQQRGVCVCQADCIFACVSERDEMRRTCKARQFASAPRQHVRIHWPTCVKNCLTKKQQQQAQERSRGARLLAPIYA